MACGPRTSWIALLIISTKLVAGGRFKFTNVKCFDHDVTFSRYEFCKLTVPKRGVVVLNSYMAIYKTPVTNISINMALYRNVNGYQPYLFNKTADLCGYFAQPKKYPLMNLIFSVFRKYSNLNHTCPYNHSLVVKDMLLDEQILEFLPAPNGQYMFKLKIYAYNGLKSTAEVAFVLRPK